jgi:RNA 2',3'-cyclic 3'-phosphodiesterase
MRLFTAINLAPEALAHLVTVQESIRGAVEARWTKPDNLHLTLKFLGEVSDQETPRLSRALDEIQWRRFSLKVDAIVCFPPRGPIRIVGAAMEDDSRLCGDLYEQIEAVCESQGFARETRAYKPHVTLARPEHRTPMQTRGNLQTSATPLLPGPEFEVSEFALIQSNLTPKGPQYTTLARYAGL